MLDSATIKLSIIILLANDQAVQRTQAQRSLCANKRIVRRYLNHRMR